MKTLLWTSGNAEVMKRDTRFVFSIHCCHFLIALWTQVKLIYLDKIHCSTKQIYPNICSVYNETLNKKSGKLPVCGIKKSLLKLYNTSVFYFNSISWQLRSIYWYLADIYWYLLNFTDGKLVLAMNVTHYWVRNGHLFHCL